MGYSAAQIGNLALSYCGVSKQITSLTDDDSVEASICNLHYTATRDTLLERFAWPFATKYAELQLVQEFEDGDEEFTDWAFSYQLPNDCLTVRRIKTGLGRQDPDPIPFTLKQSDQGLLLLTDAETPVIEYTFRFDDAKFFSPTFAKCLAWALAAEISFALSVSEQVRQRALEMAERSLSQAKVAALNSTQVSPPLDSSFLQARE